MKLDRREPNKGKRRPPLRTFTEMAEEFGLTRGQLVARMRNSKVPTPKPRLAHRNTGPLSADTSQRTWFDPTEMRTWWKAEQALRSMNGE